eukprot:gene8236-9118_t
MEYGGRTSGAMAGAMIDATTRSIKKQWVCFAGAQDKGLTAPNIINQRSLNNLNRWRTILDDQDMVLKWQTVTPADKEETCKETKKSACTWYFLSDYISY